LVRKWTEEVMNSGEAAGHNNAQNNYIYFLTVERIKLLKKDQSSAKSCH